MNNNDPLTGLPAQTIAFYNKVTIDVNGAKTPNADSSQTTNVPDRFIFYITADGKVTPADSYGQMYISKRSQPFKGQEINRANLLRDYPAQNENNIDGARIDVSKLTNAFEDEFDDDDGANNNVVDMPQEEDVDG